MKTYWLKTEFGDLVEVYSGNKVELQSGANNGGQRVVLLADGTESELYTGPAARRYLNGLAREFGAASCDWLVSRGRPRPLT